MHHFGVREEPKQPCPSASGVLAELGHTLQACETLPGVNNNHLAPWLHVPELMRCFRCSRSFEPFLSVIFPDFMRIENFWRHGKSWTSNFSFLSLIGLTAWLSYCNDENLIIEWKETFYLNLFSPLCCISKRQPVGGSAVQLEPVMMAGSWCWRSTSRTQSGWSRRESWSCSSLVMTTDLVLQIQREAALMRLHGAGACWRARCLPAGWCRPGVGFRLDSLEDWS